MAYACLILALLGAPAGFTSAPAFVPLFTPRGAAPGVYRTYTSDRDLDTVVGSLRRDPSFASVGAGREPPLHVQSVIASDAFGQSGGYNRWKLALLYGGKRVRVARGPRVEDGRVVEAWTFVSPYPDPELEKLNPGTLLIVLRLEP